MAFHFKPLKIDFSLLKGWNMIVIFSENSLLYFQNIQEASYIFRIYKKPLILPVRAGMPVRAFMKIARKGRPAPGEYKKYMEYRE